MTPRFFIMVCIVMITPLSTRAEEGWAPLFNGKDLNGWHALPGGSWEVKDGVIVGISDPSEKRHGLLVTDKQYGDFDVRLRFNVTDGDSGFYFRADESGDQVGVHGFQVEVDTTYETGGLYETGGRAWVVQPIVEELKKHYRPGEWTKLELSAHEGNIIVKINGYQTAELKNDKGRRTGHLALQLHGGQKMHVEYKDIEIRLPAKD